MAFLSDSFTDADGTALVDHVGELGATWTNHPAESGNPPPVISATNQLRRGEHTNNNTTVASAVPPGDDYSITVETLRVGAPPDGPCAGVWARLSPVTLDGYLLQYEQYSGGVYSLYSCVAGTFNLLDRITVDPPVATLSVVGDAIKVKIGGVDVISVTNSDHVSGLIGIRFDSGSVGSDVTDGIWLDTLSADAEAIGPVAITSDEAFGIPALLGPPTIRPVAVASAARVGRPGLIAFSDAVIAPRGWRESDAVGRPTLVVDGAPVVIRPVSIA